MIGLPPSLKRHPFIVDSKGAILDVFLSFGCRHIRVCDMNQSCFESGF
jgi:hypothetical protein